MCYVIFGSGDVRARRGRRDGEEVDCGGTYGRIVGKAIAKHWIEGA